MLIGQLDCTIPPLLSIFNKISQLSQTGFKLSKILYIAASRF
jgi:hypothetical protein